MVSREHREWLLRCCERPRLMTDFMQGEFRSTIRSRHIEKWLNELASEGLLARFEGAWLTTAAGRQELAELTVPPSMAVSRVHCNASMRQPYTPPQWQIRAGGDNHRRFASAGIGC